jgi:hypothetical protein
MNLLFVFEDYKVLKKELLVQEIIYIFTFLKISNPNFHCYPNQKDIFPKKHEHHPLPNYKMFKMELYDSTLEVKKDELGAH